MTPPRGPWLAALLLAAARSARADETPPPAEQPPAPLPETRWEGAIGVTASSSAEYQGAANRRIKATPGFFLRYGRWTATNAGGFVTRRSDDVMRGLGIDLSRSDRLRLGGSWSIDALGRGGGNFGDITVARDHVFPADTVWTWGASLTYAGDRYMQSYFGVDEQQSANSGYPVYEPGSGWRDVSLFTSLRCELSAEWLLLGGASAGRLVGPAAASPLTKNRDNWGVNIGLARRF